MPGIEATRARTHGQEQRIGWIAEGLRGQPSDMRKRGRDLIRKIVRIGSIVGVEIDAHFGRDGKTRWYRQADARHLGKVRSLAAEEVAHAGFSLGLAVAEGVDPFGHRCLPGSSRVGPPRALPLLTAFGKHFNSSHSSPTTSSRLKLKFNTLNRELIDLL
jgi:hypothetical protein